MSLLKQFACNVSLSCGAASLNLDWRDGVLTYALSGKGWNYWPTLDSTRDKNDEPKESD